MTRTARLMTTTLTISTIAVLVTIPAITVMAIIPTQAQTFKNCAAAYRAGFWNMKSGEPGYAPKLDRDHDGVACETDNRWVHARTSTAEALQKGGFYGAVNGTARIVTKRNSAVTGGGF